MESVIHLLKIRCFKSTGFFYPCNLVTEKGFVLRYDKATIKKHWVAQFSFGFYGLMLTSLLLGLIVMVLYKPRTWCAFCPMGTMTQGICKLKNKE